MGTKLFLGTNNLDRTKIELSEKEMLAHTAIIGGTGRGKSRIAEHFVRTCAEHKVGCIYFDPHGQSYANLVNYFVSIGQKSNIILIDPNEGVPDDGYSVGLNVLSSPYQDTSAVVSQIMRAIFKVFGEADAQTKPRLERRLRASLMALALAGYTLGELLDFAHPSNIQFRRNVLRDVKDSTLLQEWASFDALKKQIDKENLIESVLNRADKLLALGTMKRIISQQASTVDWADVVENRKIVLVNLQRTQITIECQKMLTILMIDQIMNYGLRRAEKLTKNPFYVLCDEAAEFAPDDLSYSLQALRKNGIFFWLFFQNLDQIRKDEKTKVFYANVMSCCDIKLAFHTTYDDASALVGDFFAGRIRGDKVKLDISRYDILPKETTRTIIGESHGRTTTQGTVTSSGGSESSSGGSGEAESTGMTEQYDPATGTSQFSSSGASNFSGSSSGSSWSESDVDMTSESEGVSKATVPFYEYLIQQNLGSRQYFSLEELKEKYIAWLMCQPQRHAQLKVFDKPAIPILTPHVDDVKARNQDVQKLKDYVHQRYTLPVTQVDQLIQERRQLLITDQTQESASEHTKIESDEDRFQ